MTTELIGDDGTHDAPSLTDYDVVGPYRLLQQLGEGGMGVVHLALDPHGKAVAIKVLRPHIAHDPDARARLMREVETLERVRDSHVASVLDHDLDGDQPYIVTRYVPGPNLDDVVRETGPIPRQDLHRLGQGLAEAVHAIHAVGVVHRDLKPGNVLLLDGDPVVIDFGIAHVADDVRLTMTGLVMGTPGYLSPEVVDGGEVTTATDWWGWAATLAYAASGTPPFGRGPMEVVLSRVSRGDADLSRVDPALAPLLQAALSPDPDLRPDDRTVVAALERYADGRPVTEALPVRPAVGDEASNTQVVQHASTNVLPPVTTTEDGDGYAGDSPAYEPEPVEDDGMVPWPGTVDDGREGDPRIGRARRTGTLAAVVCGLAAGAAFAPLVALAVALVWSLLARTLDRGMTSMVMRRHEFGRRRSDVPVAVVATPWHLLVSVLATVMWALLPAAVGASAMFCTVLALTSITGDQEPRAALPLAAGMLVGALMAWWGPGGASLRRGGRSLVRAAVPGPMTTRLVVVVLLVGAGAVAGWLYLYPEAVQWFPLTSSPPPFEGGRVRLP